MNNIFLSEPPWWRHLCHQPPPPVHTQTHWALKTTQKIWPFENEAATMSFHYFLLIAAWKNFLVHFLSYEVFICIKFLGKSSIQTKKQLNEVFQTRPKNIKVNVIFKSSNRLKIYFRLNDNILHAINSTVIYKYKGVFLRGSWYPNTHYVPDLFLFFKKVIQILLVLDLEINKNKLNRISNCWSPDMLKFWFFRKWFDSFFILISCTFPYHRSS